MSVIVSLVPLRIFNRWANFFYQIRHGFLYLFVWKLVAGLTIRTKEPNVSGKSTKRRRKNIPSIILTSMVPGLQKLMRFSSSTSSLKFDVFAWLNQDDTIIRELESADTAALLPYPLWLARHGARCFQKDVLSK